MNKNYHIKNDYVNSRLDKWFKRNLFNVPQSLVEKLIRKGKIKVNGKKVKSSYKLMLRDQIFIKDLKILPTLKEARKKIYIPTNKEVKSTSNLIIEDNKNFIVINKPAGLAVQPGTKINKNILDLLRTTKYFDGTVPYIVHRIDKETTGLLIVAKNREFAQLFTSLFRVRKIHKTYIAIVLGEFDVTNGTFNDNLNYFINKEKVMTRAITNYKVLYSNHNYSYLKLNPITGRKHQLRKQLLLHGHPVIGDSKYKLKENRIKKKNNLMLHSYKVNFSINDVKYEFVAEPDQLFKKTFKEKFLRNFE